MTAASNSESRKRNADVEVVVGVHRKREAAIAVMAFALDDYWGGRYQPHVVEELSDEMGVILDALFKSRAITFREDWAA